VKLAAFVVLAACGPVPSHLIDAPPSIDSARAIDARPIDAAPALEVGPYRHAIAIDGVDDFTSEETFATTSSAAGYAARVAWDATNLYVGYSGADIASGSTTKWVFAYVDLDPGGATGATTSAVYNTQHATFPTGFGAELYARWKTTATFSSIETYDGNAWSTSATPLAAAQQSTFVELAIPRSLLGGATSIGVATFMINEASGVEASYAGLYAGNFTDGYMPTLAKYLRVDFAASRTPNDPLNVAP